MELLPLQVWIEILGRVEVKALGHTVDPYFGAQMGLGITGMYTIKVKMTILKLCLPFHFQYFLNNQSKYTSVTKQFKHAQNCKKKKKKKNQKQKFARTEWIYLTAKLT